MQKIKKSIRNTLTIFLIDWKRILKSPVSLLLSLALMVIPSLYAWFNIEALWDPYGNTSELMIGVVSDDKGAIFGDMQLNIGDKIIDSLHENDKLGWKFADNKEELRRGVESGKYYASIYLPPTFSKDLMSFTKGEISKPTIEYTVNQKINAIAPKIAEKGASTIQTQISDEFTSTLSHTLIETMNTVGFDIEANLPTLNKISTMVLDLDNNLPEINGYIQEIRSINDRLPELKEKLNVAREFVSYIPEINNGAQKVIEINGAMDQINQAGKMIENLQKQIPEIENAGRQLQIVDNDFDNIVKKMEEAVNEADRALDIIEQVQPLIPDLIQLTNNASTIVGASQDALPQITEALHTVGMAINTAGTTLKNVLNDLNSTYNSIAEIIEANHEITDNDRELIQQVIQTDEEIISTSLKVVGNLQDTIESIKTTTGTTELDTILAQLQAVEGEIQTVSSQIAQLKVDEPQLSSDEMKARLIAIRDAKTTLLQTVNAISIDSISGAVDALMATVAEDLNAADRILDTSKSILPTLPDLLTNTSATIQSGLSYFNKYKGELPKIKNEVHQANVLLNENMDLIKNGINKGASFYTQEFPQIRQELNKVVPFLQNDLPVLEDEIVHTFDVVDAKMPMIESALNTANLLIEHDWPTIESGIHKAAAAIKTQQETIDLSDVIKLLKADANAETEFLVHPVDVKTIDLYPIPNYGSASTPFYTVLCLWVGGVLFSSIASTRVYVDEKQKNKFSARQKYAGRYLTFLFMGLCQALIVALGNIFLLHTYVADPVWIVIFTLFVAFVFMTIIYTLVGLFENIGKGIAVIILVLSISGGGGNFPIQLSNKFFQFIHPLLPFTHAVNLLREPTGGIYWPNTIKALVILISIAIGFLVAGVMAYPYVKKAVRKFGEKAAESHLYH